MRINRLLCIGCKLCMFNCPVGTVIGFDEKERTARLVNPWACGGCGACLRGCPTNAIHIKEVLRSDALDYSIKEVRAPGQGKARATGAACEGEFADGE